MAQAQYDKFIELRKSGVDALTARKQAYGDIPTAPTVTPAPVTPTPTGGATLPIAPEVTPTQPVPPPVAPTPVQPAPVTQTPTPPTPAPTTPAPIVDKNAEIKAQNEATMAENKQQAELRQAERDKVTQDANNALASNEGAILNTLKTGGIIPDSVKTSPYYKSAQQTYNKLQQFSTYSIGELTTALDNGSILPGTSVYNELLKDPAMKQKLTEAQSYTTGVPSIPQSETVTQEIIANNPTTASYLADGVITQDEWDNATNNAEVVAKAKDVEAKTNKYNQLYAEYEAIEGEVKSQFPGSPFADSIIADRQKAKYKNVLLAKGEMDTANGTLTELKSNAANLFETNLKLYQDQQKQANEYKMADYQAKLGMQKSVFDANLGIKTKQAEFEQGLAQQAEMAKDPTTAIGGILSQFQKLGITSDMDVAGHLASFQASGLTLPEYTKQMIEKFKAKPEYQKAMQLQMGQLSDAQKMNLGYQQDLSKMQLQQNFEMKIAQAKNVADNKWTKLDDGLYQDANGNMITADELKQAKLFNNSYLSKGTGEEGGDCGFYASRGTGMTSTPGGNSKDARFKAFSDTTPQVGGMAFFGGEGYDKTYGHIAIVTGVNPDGSLTVKDSNYKGDGKVQERTVPASSVSGYYNNTPLARGVGGQAGNEYNDQNINDLAYLTELQEKNPTQAAKDMKELGYTARDLANYKAGNVPLTEKQKIASTDIMSAIKDLTSQYDWNDAVGKFDPSRVLGMQDAEDATVAINNLIAKMTLPNLGVLKGPMSDKDIQFIKEASSKLATTQSNKSFERNLLDAYNLAARRAGQQEITKLSDIGTPAKQTVGGEKSYSKYE